MDSKILLGFKQVNGLAAGFDVKSLESGYIYFVRTSTDKEEGYLYFNGKKYGNVAELREEVHTLYSSVTKDIQAEETRAMAAESALTSALEAEVARAKAAEKQNADDIDAEEERAEKAESAITKDLNAEIARAKDAEADLKDEIDDLSSGAVADIVYTKESKEIKLVNGEGETVGTPIDASDFIKDGFLSSVTYDSSSHTITFVWNTDAGHDVTVIDISDLIDPDELAAAIKKETDRAMAAEKELSDAIKKETERAEAAESALTQAVETEKTRAETAEEVLTDEIAAEETRAEAAEAALSAKTNDLQDQIDNLNDKQVAVAEDIVISGNTVATKGEEVHSVLTDIYKKLGEAEASDYTGVTSTGKSITVTDTENGNNVEVNREAATDATVADGHIELQQNSDGALYGVLYYAGDDTEA